MLVLATLLAIGLFCVAFLLRFLFALNSEIQLENERSARTKQIVSHRIPIAVGVRRPSLTVTYANPGLVYPSKPRPVLPETPMRRALASLSGTHSSGNESLQKKREA